MRTLVIVIGLLTVGALAASAAAAAPRDTVALRASAYGKVLVDGRGFVLYAFTRDPRRGRSTCSGACARAWPPYLLRGAFHAGAGTKGASIASIRRADGSRQVTYGGRPLYHYVGDREPGQILCQNVREFGGLWLVLRASGMLVRGS